MRGWQGAPCHYRSPMGRGDVPSGRGLRQLLRQGDEPQRGPDGGHSERAIACPCRAVSRFEWQRMWELRHRLSQGDGVYQG